MQKTIKNFVEDKNLALIGVSKDRNKFGNILVKELSKRGYTLYPVHPELKFVEETKCYASLEDLPEKVQNLLLVVQPKVTEEIIASITSSGIKRVWMHKGAGKGSASPRAIEECKKKGIEAVYGFRPMMFMAGTGVHRLHLWFRKNFGTTPPEFKEQNKVLSAT